MQHPDFICVGSQKAGTAWLYDQLEAHPHVWMPPIKELRYFIPRFPHVKARAARRFKSISSRAHRRQDDPRAIEFLRRVSEATGTSIAEYTAFYEPAGPLATGDISPGYHALSEDRIRELASGLPHCRFLFLVRDPIGRLWSQLNMLVRAGKRDASALTNREEFERFIKLPSVVSPSFQSRTIAKWLGVVGEERFRVFVMDRLRKDADGYRQSIFSYLGLDAAECSVPASYNRKEADQKSAMPPEFRSLLLDYFDAEYQQLSPYLPRPQAKHAPDADATTSLNERLAS